MGDQRWRFAEVRSRRCRSGSATRGEEQEDTQTREAALQKLSEQEIQALVLDVLHDLNLVRQSDQPLQLSADSPLFGADGQLDSMELVALAMDIEDAFAARGIDISVSDEKAMSDKHSPFRDVPSLVAYLGHLVSAENDGA